MVVVKPTGAGRVADPNYTLHSLPAGEAFRHVAAVPGWNPGTAGHREALAAKFNDPSFDAFQADARFDSPEPLGRQVSNYAHYRFSGTVGSR